MQWLHDPTPVHAYTCRCTMLPSLRTLLRLQRLQQLISRKLQKPQRPFTHQNLKYHLPLPDREHGHHEASLAFPASVQLYSILPYSSTWKQSFRFLSTASWKPVPAPKRNRQNHCPRWAVWEHWDAARLLLLACNSHGGSCPTHCASHCQQLSTSHFWMNEFCLTLLKWKFIPTIFIEDRCFSLWNFTAM